MKDKIVDASMLLALATAGMYFWGCLYYEGYYSIFGIPFYSIDIPTRSLLLFSYAQVLTAALSFIVISIIAFGISKIPDDRRNMPRGTRWIGLIGHSLKETFSKSGIGIPVLFILAFYLLAGIQASNQGKKEGLEKLNSLILQQNTVEYNGGKLEKVGYLVASNDLLYFYRKPKQANTLPEVFEIPKDSIKFIQTR